jgi:phage-related protein
MAGTSRALTLKLLADIDNFTKNINKADNEVTSFGDKIKKFAKVAAAAFAVAGGVAIRFGVDAVKSASDLSETIAKTGEIFGDSAGEVEAFAATAAKRLGQTKQQALDAASTFAIFGRSAGLAGKDLVKFSTDFTGLASDLASFNNTSPEDAINAIGSALRGEAEPLRRYGVLLNDASLRQAALELGIISTTKNALTPQQKVLAAQALIYQQTSLAQGDFERTSAGLANQQRILAAQIENVKTTIGMALLPIVLEMTTFFARNVLPIIEQLGNAFASDGEDSFRSKMSSVVDVIKRIVLPAFNGLIAGFDLIRDAIQRNSDKLEPFFTLIKAIAGFIVAYLAPAISQTLGVAFKVVGTIISTVIDQFANFLSTLTSIFNAIKRIIDFVKGAGNIVGNLLGFNNASSASFSTPGFTNAPFTPSPSAGAFSGQAVNITVNGAIDSESTARQIVSVLNQSSYRGTLGAGAFA